MIILSIVDIIVLSHNQKSISTQFIDILYSNTPIDSFRVIWLDNGSLDGSPEILQSELGKRQNAILFLEQENLGVIGGRNLAYELLTKEAKQSSLLMFLDNDQMPQAGWLENHLQAMKNKDMDMIGVEAWRMSRMLYPAEKIEREHQSYHYVGCGGMMMKKEIPATIGLFDNQFNPCYFEDPDFCFRAFDAGYRIGWNPQAKIVHLAHIIMVG